MTEGTQTPAKHLWATPSDALKLLLTGSVIGRLSSEQRTIYMTMLARVEKQKAGDSGGVVWPGVRTMEHCVDETNNQLETLCHIPDVARYMISVFDDWNLQDPPLDLDYLNHLTDEFGQHQFMYGEAPGVKKWQDSEEGKAHWALVCRKLELAREMAELEKTHHANDPSKLESQRRVRKELQEELQNVVSALAAYRAPADGPIRQTNSTIILWHEPARILGQRYHAESPHLSVEQIAGKVHQALAEKGITGRGGKVPKPETIKRHALAGLKN